jgi:alpha-tubulin suppressor-like RCC1 family protein
MNSYGQLGNGTTTMSRVPVTVTMNGALSGRTVIKVVAGDATSFALCADGSVAAWGFNVLAQAGTDGTRNSKVPVIIGNAGVLTGKAVAAFTAGGAHTHALATDGTFAAWGTNSYGQLGNNSLTNSLLPVAVTTSGILKDKTLAAIEGREAHSVALCTDGTLAAWGYNTYGQLGNGTFTDSRVPGAVVRGALAPGELVTQLAAGSLSRHSLVLAALPLSGDSTLAGLIPSAGSLKPGFAADQTSYVLRVPHGAAAIALRPTVTVADATVTVNGTAVASGAASGPIALPTGPITVTVTAQNGSTTTYTVTVEGDSSLAALSVAGATLLPGFSPNTTAYQAHVSPETTAVTLTPVLADPAASVTVAGTPVSSGTASAPVALAPGPNVIAVVGTAPDGSTTRYEVTVVRQIPLVAAFPAAGSVPVTADSYVATANTINLSLGHAPATGTNLTVINLTGSARITGRFSNLAHGQRVNLTYNKATFPFIANYHGGDGNDLVLLWANTRLLAWGTNTHGQLGDGTTTRSLIPVPVASGGALAGKSVYRLSAGADHTVALCTDGTVVTWGRSQYGQLGTGSTTTSTLPVAVTTSGALAGKTVIDVTTGTYHSVALCADGTVVAWGNNDYGQLGTGTTTQGNVPVAVLRNGALAGKFVTTIAAGGSNSMALCADGTLAVWGKNVAGQIGDMTNATRTAPVAVTKNGALATRTVRAIDTGDHSLVLCTDGTLVAWGNNDSGQLGIGNTTRVSTPTAVTITAALTGKTIRGIDTGSEHSIAWCTDGTAAAWGDNYYGQLADGNTTDRPSAVAVAKTGVLAGKSIASLAAAYGHSLILASDGTLAASGYNNDGQLGNNSTTNSYGPTAVSTTALAAGEVVTAVFSGPVTSQSFAITALPLSSNSKLAALALGGATLSPAFAAATGTYIAQVHAGATAITLTPTAADPGATITVNGTAVASGATSAPLIPVSGSVIEVEVTAANGTTTVYQITPRADSSLAALGVSAGALEPAFAAGVTGYVDYVPPGTAELVVTPTAGDPAAGIKVNGVTVASGTASSPVALAAGLNTVAVVVTAVDNSSTTYELRVIRQVAVNHTYPSATTAAVTAGGYTATNNTANLALGFAPPVGTQLTVVNNTGNEPISGRFSNLAQAQVVTLSYNNISYRFVADYYGGTGNDLVLRWAKTKAYAWGYNNNGQLGNGTTTDRSAPTAVTATGVLAGKTLIAVANGGYHTLALGADGTLAAWGSNEFGQLGNGTTTNSSNPVLVNRNGVLAGKTVVAIAAGMSTSLVLCADGTLASWGKGAGGSLGTGGTANSSVPVLVKSDGVLAGRRPVAIASGTGHSLVLCADGALVTWGLGDSGQLGNGTFNNNLVPVQVTATGLLATKTVQSIAVGSDHSLAVCSDGTVAVWGYNYSGQLGTGNTTTSNVPVAVTTTGVLAGRKVIRAAGGYTQSLVQCADGTLATWGSGTYGQLGQGSNSSSNVPVAVVRGGVLSGKTVAALSGGGAHHVVATTDGILATWGYNSLGQLGTGTMVNSNVPVLPVTTGVGAGEKFIALAPAPNANFGTAIAAVPFSSNSQLAGLTVNAGTLSPAFGPGTTDYALRVAPGVTTITVTPTAAEATATITVNGGIVASGAASPPVSIAGSAPVTITVTAENGASTSYILSTRGDSLLTGLSLSAGTLEPAFSGAVTSYTANVSAATAAITVTPTPSDPQATVEVNGGAVVSGSASAPVALVPGGNTLTVKVTAPDASSTSYQVLVTRQVPLVHTFTSAASVAATANDYIAAGNTVTLALGYAPATGTNLTVINNTGPAFIEGRFDNLTHGQRIGLSHGGKTYEFVANYFGGGGNDLVLQWASVRLAGWGRNANGEFACAGLQYSLTPAPTATVGTLAGRVPLVLTGGFQHGLALCADGTLAAWGANATGQVGDNSTTTRMIPVAVDRGTVLAGKTLVAIAAGGSHSLAAAEDGTVAAWGDNTRGQLGNGTYTQANRPAAVIRTGALANKTVRALAAGSSHSLALCTDGSLVAWGGNSQGQLGNGSTTGTNVPVAVSMAGVLAGKTVIGIAAGGNHSAALCADGSVATWGDNSYGQLGDNSTALKTTPVLVDRSGVLAGKTVVALASGASHLLARCSDGTLAAWGFGQSGQLGTNASLYSSKVPVAVYRSGVLSGKTTAGLACGERHSLVANTDGTAAAWGNNMYGALGDNGSSDRNGPVSVLATQLTAGERFAALTAGSDYSMAIIASPPAALVTTTAASAIDDTRATANGLINANGTTASVWIEYGPTASYGTLVPAVPATVTGTTETAVSAPLGGLLPGTTYHFRAIVRTAGGTVAGNNRTFTTSDLAGLVGLSCDAGALTPGFAPAETGYRLTVPFATAALAVTPTALAAAALAVNGQPATSGEAATVPLTVDATDIAVAVTAAGGNTRTYMISVNRLPESLAFPSPAAVPVTAAGLVASGSLPAITLGFAPVAGTRLMVVRNTGTAPIDGTFTGLAHGQRVELTFGTTTYPFIADYFGGDGNDLVLHWANLRAAGWGSNTTGALGVDTVGASYTPVVMNHSGALAGKTILRLLTGYAVASDGTVAAWGANTYGQLGNGTTAQSKVPVAVARNGALAGKTVVTLAAASRHVLALCADGTLVAWGYNSHGQLGNGSTTDSPVPVAVDRTGVLAGRRVIAVAAGFNHSLALCADGTIAAWGSNLYGQLGNATVAASTVPVAVDRVGALATAVPVGLAAGHTSSFARCADGTVAAWGANQSGNLGVATPASQSVTPVAVTHTGVLAGKQVAALAASQHCLALCTDGTAVAWGYNNKGQLGNNSTSNGQVPVLIAKTGALAGKTIAALAAADSYSLALCTDGTIATWGGNLNGELGDNTGTDRMVPVAVQAGQLFANNLFAAAAGVASSNALSATPVPAVDGLAATGIGGTTATVQARVNAWGIPAGVTVEYGSDPTFGTTVTATPASVSATTATQVGAALGGLAPGTTYHYRVVAAGDGGTVRSTALTFTTLSDNAWLAGLALDQGAVDPGFARDTSVYQTTVPFTAATVAVTAPTEHPAATVRYNGGASNQVSLAVGANRIQIDVTAEDGTTRRTYQISVIRLPETFRFDAANVVPVTADGFATGGYPAQVVLAYAPAPGTVLTMVNNTGLGFIKGGFSNLAQGQRVGLAHDGKTYDFVANYFGGSGNDLVLQWAATDLQTWGANQEGQLGDATTERRLAPGPVATSGVLAGKTVIAVAGGYLHSLALCADGTLAAWGYNIFGQLGNDSTVSSKVPVAVERSGALAGQTVVAISAGPFHNLALCADGTLAAWGYNNYGQLGTGDTVTARVPVRVNPGGALLGKRVVAVAAAAYHSFALCDDGTVAGWGFNEDGELGNHRNTTSTVPVAVDASGVLAGKRVAAVAAGRYHTLALCTDGTLVAWGYNHRGQLGTNSIAASNVPVAIGTAGALAGKTVVAIAAGDAHSLALSADGTLAAWGWNHHGQLGLPGGGQTILPTAIDVAAISSGSALTRIACGGRHSMALRADGLLAAWGDNADGQLGNHTTVPGAVPAWVDLTAAGTVMIAGSGAAGMHNLAVVAPPAAAAGARESAAAATESATVIDSDSDGLPDLIEYAFGLAPGTNGAGQLPQPQRIGDHLTIRFTEPAGVTGIHYGAEWSATLEPGSWLAVPNSGAGTDHEFRVPVTGAPRMFMRLKVTLRQPPGE